MKPSPEKDMSMTTETKLVVCDTEERPHKYSAMLCINARPTPQPALDAGEQLFNRILETGAGERIRMQCGAADLRSVITDVLAATADRRSAAAVPKLTQALNELCDAVESRDSVRTWTAMLNARKVLQGKEQE
jgi:hypothetical protein